MLLQSGDLQSSKEREYVEWVKKITYVDCLLEIRMDEKWVMKSQKPIQVYIENQLFFWIGMIDDKKHNYYSIGMNATKNCQ